MSIVVAPSTTQSPTAPTLSDLKRQAARYVHGDNFQSVLQVAADGVNDAIDHLNLRQWNWNLKSKDITLVDGDGDYEIPDDWFKPRVLQRINSSSKEEGRLVWMTPKEFTSEFPNRTADGSPRTYTVMSINQTRLLLLEKPPNATFIASFPTLRSWYYAQIPYPASDGISVKVPPRINAFIRWHARMYVASETDKVSKITLAERMASRAWTQAFVEDRKNRTDF